MTNFSTISGASAAPRRGKHEQRRQQPRHRPLAALIGLLLASCGAGGSSGWEVASETDPMTDVGITRAKQRLTGEQFDVEVEVTCNSRGGSSYTLTTFDKDEAPAPFRQAWMRNQPTHVVQIRKDEAAANEHWQHSPSFNNQIKLPGGGGTSAGGGLIAAMSVTIRIPMLNGEETITLDQSDPAFRSAVDPCVAAQQKAIDEEAAKEAARRAELAASLEMMNAQQEAAEAEYQREREQAGAEAEAYARENPVGNTTYQEEAAEEAPAEDSNSS